MKALLLGALALFATPAIAGPCDMITSGSAVFQIPNPIEEAWRMCQSQAHAGSAACVEVKRQYDESGIAARRQKEVDEALSKLRECERSYIDGVAARSIKAGNRPAYW